MSWLISALSARALWAGSNLVDKALLEKYIRQPLLYLWVNGLVGLLPVVIVFWRPISWPSTQLWPLLALTGCLSIYALLPYYRSLQLTEASRVVPLWHLTPLIVLLFGFILLHEVVGVSQIFGISCLASGGLLLAGDQLFPFKLNRAIGYMLLADLLYASELLCVKYIYATAPNFATGLVWLSVSSALALIPSVLFKPWRQGLWQHWQNLRPTVKSAALGNGVINLAAIALNQFAIAQVAVALASSVDATQSLFVLGLSLLASRRWPQIFNEHTTVKNIFLKLVAIVAIGLGLYFIV